jgi:uncharacterized protein (TIGR02996 family)
MTKKRKESTPITTAPEVQPGQQAPEEGGAERTPAAQAAHEAALRSRRRQRRASFFDEEDEAARFHYEDEDEEPHVAGLPDGNPRHRHGPRPDEDDEKDALPTFPVANTNPTLLAFLTAVPDDPGTGHALADWLLEQDDPRAAHVRELAEARCVLPEGSCPLLRAAPMACGTWWCIVLRPWCVSALAYWDTPLYKLVRASRPGGDITVRLARDRPVPERLHAAFERCRTGLLLALFGTTPEHLRARQVVLTEDNLKRVDKVLAKQQTAVIPWLLELRETNPARFEVVLARSWETSELHELGYALLDTLDPSWRQRLPAMMAGGAGSSTQ